MDPRGGFPAAARCVGGARSSPMPSGLGEGTRLPGADDDGRLPLRVEASNGLSVCIIISFNQSGRQGVATRQFVSFSHRGDYVGSVGAASGGPSLDTSESHALRKARLSSCKSRKNIRDCKIFRVKNSESSVFSSDVASHALHRHGGRIVIRMVMRADAGTATCQSGHAADNSPSHAQVFGRNRTDVGDFFVPLPS